MITQENLKELLDYDSETGVFYWKISRQRIKIGAVAGSLNSNGYIHIRILSKLYQAHRLVWLYVNGTFPSNTIDHINSIRNDNRISNLREVTQSQNCMNKGKQSNNTSGHKGVSWYKPYNKWLARIRINNKHIHLGYFYTIEDAIDAYKEASIKFHGEFANVAII